MTNDNLGPNPSINFLGNHIERSSFFSDNDVSGEWNLVELEKEITQ